MTTTTGDGLTLLGRPVRGAITAAELETFPNPGVAEVRFRTTELTARCPITGQPDVYTATIVYRPASRCLESKALKLYLHGFRDTGVFCEALARRIHDDLAAALAPTALTVTLDQSVRGGLTLSATAGDSSP